MAYNHAKAEKEFLAMWEKKSAEYREAGMSEESIQEMYKFEREIFLSYRREEEHRAEFPGEPMSETFSENDFSGRYAWVETLDNPELARALKRLKHDDLELLTMWVMDEMSQKEIADFLKCSPPNIKQKLNRLKKYFENFSSDT